MASPNIPELRLLVCKTCMDEATFRAVPKIDSTPSVYQWSMGRGGIRVGIDDRSKLTISLQETDNQTLTLDRAEVSTLKTLLEEANRECTMINRVRAKKSRKS